MKKRIGLLLFAASLVSAQMNAPRQKVIMISLDGFPGAAMDDPQTPVPTLRKLVASGVTATMTPINPTITWPNHTTLVTGVRADEHGLLVNGEILRTGAWPPVRIDSTIGKEKMVRVPTVYDAAHKAGLTTAQVDWVAINDAPSIDWAFPERAAPEGQLEREMIAKGVLSASDVADFSKQNILRRDQIWTRAGVWLIREKQPDLLLIHFLSLDSEQHQYGPNTQAARTAMAFLDSCVEKLVAAVHDAGLDNRTTFFVVSDHGFKGYTKQIHASDPVEAAGLGKQVYVLPEGGSAYVYISEAQVNELLPRVRQILQNVEGVDRVYGAADYAALGLPKPEPGGQFGQLWLTAKTGYSFSGSTGGPASAAAIQTGGSHAYPASDPDMNPLFIAAGAGIHAHGKLPAFPNVNIAPTIAQILGISLPTARGTTLAVTKP